MRAFFRSRREKLTIGLVTSITAIANILTLTLVYFVLSKIDIGMRITEICSMSA